MAGSAGLLHALRAAFGGVLAAGRCSSATSGVVGLEALAAQHNFGARWLSAVAREAEAAAPGPHQDAQLATAPSAEPSARASSADQASTSGDTATTTSSGEAGFNVGFRRVVLDRRGVQQGAMEGIVHIQNTFNNIIITLTDKQGAIKTYTSAGVVGFRGARKSQPLAAERAAEELARRALKLGYSTVAVRLKGPGGNKQYAVQSLAAAGLQITSLADVTPVPYNGCRLPKKRRV